MARYKAKPSKYRSQKMQIDGITFDSIKEARRWSELRLLEKAGAIQDLRRQVKFVLIPAQREFTNEKYTKGPMKGYFKKGKLLERECAYIADFTYRDKKGNIIVEDTKGIRTTEYIIKRKLMLFVHGIKIQEV